MLLLVLLLVPVLVVVLDDATACCEPIEAADHRESGNSQVDGVTSVLRLKINDLSIKHLILAWSLVL